MGSRHGKRRWLRRAVLVFGILAALLALVAATRNRWGPSALETALARFAGIEARIGATEGPWIDGYFVSPWQPAEHPLADLGS